MLVFISDIHLTDETAFPSYLAPRVVEKIFYESLEAILERRPDVKELHLILLGDFFDLIRTLAWWTIRGGKWIEKDVTPWHGDRSKLEAETLKVLNSILAVRNNKGFVNALHQLPGRLKKEFPRLTETAIHYVPGNHDRLITFRSLKTTVKDVLGARIIADGGYYRPPGYKVLAMHGHQLDMLNREDKGIPPFGDFISSLVTALPYWIESDMKQALKKGKLTGVSKNDIQVLKQNLLRVDDVRPQSAILPWILSQVKGQKEIEEYMEGFILDRIGELRKNEFLQKWLKAHDRELGAYDEIFNLLALLFSNDIVKWISRRFLSLDSLVSNIQKLSEDKKDHYAEGLLKAANKEINKKGDPYLKKVQTLLDGVDLVILGHTHVAKVVPLRKDISYLNTGTWRKYTYQTLDRKYFTSLHNLSFVVVYKEDEAVDRRFEQWNASMSKEVPL